MAGADEFEEAARATTTSVRGAPLTDRIAVACRGSANPAALAWIAEGVALGPRSVVVDLGAGLGGPAAWLELRYGCRVVALEPAPSAAEGAAPLFDLAAVRADASGAPLRDACADAALLLGVVSVVADPVAALAEARRVAARLGVLDYCAAGDAPVHAGGSTFPTRDLLDEWMRAAGWTVDVAADVDLPTPSPWQHAVDAYSPDETSDDEDEVRHAIQHGEVEPRMVVAS